MELDLPLLIQLLFLPMLASAYLFYHLTHKSSKESADSCPEFSKFQKLYFLPYFVALFADWLQGPYVYKLYSYYGFPQGQIAILYLTGFASSVTFGTATGPLADKFGRKRMSIVFCFLYTLSCLTKLSPNFNILLLGRIMGGVSTSILFSVFESWYIHQHTNTGKFPLEWISNTFSKATFFNGLLAIFAGVVADIGADRLDLGPVAPFMIAIPCLLMSCYIILTTWDENYGEQQMNWGGSCLEGLSTITNNPQILLLGLCQSVFESNMYIFVFMWTPVLEPGNPPLGLTFSCFMISIMIGSSIYSMLLTKGGLKSDTILTMCLGLMAFSMFGAALFTGSTVGPSGPNLKSGGSGSSLIVFFFFLILEIAVGTYFPAIGYLRSEVIPDGLRANIMNWFRVPMNILTCGGLMGMKAFDHHPNSNQTMFIICGVMSLLGLQFSRRFSVLKGFKKLSVGGDSGPIIRPFTEKNVDLGDEEAQV